MEFLRSYRWRNYDAGMARFFNADPLSEKYAYQSHYNFSENRVVDGRELEGLEVVLLKKSSYNNDIIDIANSGRYKDDPFTNTVHLFAHENPKEFYNETYEGETTINSGAALNNVLMQGSELWKNAKSHEGFTVVIHACRTGRVTTNEKGKWNTFEDGKNTEQHPGDWVPSGGGGIWNRILF
ncbi:hypothetical protein SAMN06265171_106276 [Chryseobacterium rhizoplanae]|uniref:RHS repeat-associated core domain-containing protein n=1 Tax=Chryseobacterium rhizoplanae TaxID=1609531 RepID=A0A521E0I9_9FLAO|nr:hypothetical protein [Chryseobacterium rhizoplanae]SMO77477.1 hypothetical protein SAMN06265171_106276 [Chryseobacterium rhizoplanae]